MIARGLIALAVLAASTATAHAHAGSSTPVPRGCRAVVETVIANGKEVVIRRIACPDRQEQPVSGLFRNDPVDWPLKIEHEQRSVADLAERRDPRIGA